MFFIGSGSLLRLAISFALSEGFEVLGVCSPVNDIAVPSIKKVGIPVIESNNPNLDFFNLIKKNIPEIVFSINNKFILDDNLLRSGPRFYNIHNGLIQHYRGIGEVCILAALRNKESLYGVTLHQLLPNQGVDQGPVISQISFKIKKDSTFSELLELSLKAYQEIFELNLSKVVTNSYKKSYIEASPKVYTYKDVKDLFKDSEPHRIHQITNLGKYSGFFPKLSEKIKEAIDEPV